MKRIITILSICSISATVWSQQLPDLTELRTPASPGFILSDQTPSSIERPTTPQGLAVGIISLQQGGALETAPFWLTNHIDYKFNNLAFNAFPIPETFSLSVSSNRGDSVSMLSAGARVQLLKLWSASSRKSVEDLRDSIVDLLNDVDPDTMDPNLESRIQDMSRRLSKMVQKPTLVVEAATAILGSTAENNFNNLKRSRVGVWTSINFNPSVNLPLSFVGLARYVDNPYFGEYARNTKIFDYGLRVVYGLNRLGISGEYIQRSELSNNINYNRLAAIVEYKLYEGIYATATFGKNYSEISNIIALFGVNLGMSKKSNVAF
jgi:hypothetical protein